MASENKLGITICGGLYVLAIIALCHGCMKMSDAPADASILNQADKDFEMKAAYTDLKVLALANVAIAATTDNAVKQCALGQKRPTKGI